MFITVQEKKTMNDLFQQHLDKINEEISDYEKQLEIKKQEAEEITQLENEAMTALDELQTLIENIQKVDPEAIDLLYSATKSIFEDGDVNAPLKPINLEVNNSQSEALVQELNQSIEDISEITDTNKSQLETTTQCNDESMNTTDVQQSLSNNERIEEELIKSTGDITEINDAESTIAISDDQSLNNNLENNTPSVENSYHKMALVKVIGGKAEQYIGQTGTVVVDYERCAYVRFENGDARTFWKENLIEAS